MGDVGDVGDVWVADGGVGDDGAVDGAPVGGVLVDGAPVGEDEWGEAGVVGGWVGLGELLGVPPGVVDGELLGELLGVPLGVVDGWLEGLPDGVLLGWPLGLVEGVPLGWLDDGWVEGVPDGAVDGGVLGPPLPLPFPLPLRVTTAPLGSNRTCACQLVGGAVFWSTVIFTTCCAPAGNTPELWLSMRNGASAVAVQATGALPEFQSVTVSSLGLFVRWLTLTLRTPCAAPGLDAVGSGPGNGAPCCATPPAGGTAYPAFTTGGNAPGSPP